MKKKAIGNIEKIIQAFTKKEVREGLTEAMRMAVFAFIAVLVSALLDIIPQLDVDPIHILILTTLLRALDRYVHERNKRIEGSDGTSKGLLRI